MKNSLEQLQEKTNGIVFIKSYPILNYLSSISSNQKQFIELVLSYQHNGKEFCLKYQTIADILCIEYQTVKDMVNKLKKMYYFKTYNSKNYNDVTGGSRTAIKVIEIHLIEDIEKAMKAKNTSTIKIKSIPEPLPIEPESIEDEIDLDDDDTITFGAKPIEPPIKKRHTVDNERYDKLKELMQFTETPYTLENMLSRVMAESEKDDIKRIYNERHPLQ